LRTPHWRACPGTLELCDPRRRPLTRCCLGAWQSGAAGSAHPVLHSREGVRPGSQPSPGPRRTGPAGAVLQRPLGHETRATRRSSPTSITKEALATMAAPGGPPPGPGFLGSVVPDGCTCRTKEQVNSRWTGRDRPRSLTAPVDAADGPVHAAPLPDRRRDTPCADRFPRSRRHRRGDRLDMPQRATFLGDPTQFGMRLRTPTRCTRTSDGPRSTRELAAYPCPEGLTREDPRYSEPAPR